MEFSKSQKAIRETWTGLRMNTAEWHQRSRSRDLIAKLKKKYTFLLFCVWISEYVNIYRNCLKRYLTCGIKKKIVLRCKKKKTFVFEKIDKNVQINSLKAGWLFLSENWRKLSVWSSVLFTVSALKIREREGYWKQTKSNVLVLLNNVSALEHERFNCRLSHEYLGILKPKS